MHSTCDKQPDALEFYTTHFGLVETKLSVGSKMKLDSGHSSLAFLNMWEYCEM